MPVQAIAVLPERHPWQEHVALHVGMRTGYCGSLTTFSAWLLQCVQLLVGGSGRDGGQWAQVLHLELMRISQLGFSPVRWRESHTAGRASCHAQSVMQSSNEETVLARATVM